MYPLKFKSLYYEKVWGADEFKIPRENVPKGNIGESWDIACHPNGMSIVKNGAYKGMSLEELIRAKGEDLIGNKINKDKFPLLVKILNTSARLSVQVHPGDEYALINEGEMGKTEAWYILDAEEDANIIVGTNNCTKDEFIQSIAEGTIENRMNSIKVKKGDVYFIKSGLVHAIGAGIMLIEVQQNSDTTYRVYDYGRDRELHIEKALEVIDFELVGKGRNGIFVAGDNYDKTYYCLNEHFSLELYDIKRSLSETSDTERFFIFTCVENSGIIKHKNGQEEINIGDSILIPAKLGDYEIIGNLKLLKTYLPDVSQVEKEILEYTK
ncbi:MAG: mannose-6-phosphate isomerase, class I [Tissierella sp.]|nr:mannose-6-phosphate isomerase, class I [Tissierella sp.]